MTDPVRVLLVDDQSIVRAGIAALLTGEPRPDPAGPDPAGPPIEVVGEASDGATALSLVRSLRPAVVLMDVRMPGTGGVEATREIRADPQCRDVAVLMLTTFDTDAEVLGALRAGADGYLLKDADPDELRSAVRAAARGEPALSPAVARQVMARAAATPAPLADPRIDRLTDREREVLAAVARGDDNATVARELRLSPETVRTYVSRILTKLGANSRAQLVAIAHRSGLNP
ncbi:response regulator [Paractinoplanes rishiriensis]|uniref:DNA-binding response regulator n=1 Tax=Paractinoplanes rishiriensis TaxID=1050105 RepID=A0A919KB64_9ACTN|nr:response regulator transcription factor [Actinoplanes rishiriensis]GIF01914.1 DNA-binding response regulator [Actinoplanes rishiriensis]